MYAPKYYNEFKCIADKCTHSCCVGWEIDVDCDTLKKYSACEHSYGKEIRNSIDCEDTPHFRLCEGERCPHLDKNGLCNIITHLGEDYLCDICREHPRFYNETPHGMEVGLGMACEEACRIILNSNEYDCFVEITSSSKETEVTSFDPTLERAYIYSLLKDYSLSYEDRLKSIYNRYRVSPFALSDDKWREIICSLEYLDESHKELFSSYSSSSSAPKETEKELERALAYFIYRHCSEAYDYGELCAGLGFCLFCERLLCSLAEKRPDEILTLARIVSEEIEYSIDNTQRIKEEFLF